AVNGINDTNKTKCPALFPGRWHVRPGWRLRCNRVAVAHANQQHYNRASGPKHKAPPGDGQVCLLVFCAMPMAFHSRSTSHKRQAFTEPQPRIELRDTATTLRPEKQCTWRWIGIVKHVAFGVDLYPGLYVAVEHFKSAHAQSLEHFGIRLDAEPRILRHG